MASTLEPHWANSIERMRHHPVVLNIQDTTELNFNGGRLPAWGPLSYDAQRGLYLHPSYVITPAREPLGVLDAWIWAREPKTPMACVMTSRKVHAGSKAMSGWLNGPAHCRKLGKSMSQIAEADILALPSKPVIWGHAADYLIRCQHNRALPGGGKPGLGWNRRNRWETSPSRYRQDEDAKHAQSLSGCEQNALN